MFNIAHKFVQDNLVPYYVPPNRKPGTHGGDTRNFHTYFTWDEYPELRDRVLPLLKRCDDKIAVVNEELFLANKGLTPEELEYIEVGWEDEFYHNVDNYLK